MSAITPRVRFAPDDGFRAELESRAEAYLARTGQRASGGAAMHGKTAAILAWHVGAYALLLAFGASSPALAALLTLSLALSTVGIGFAVMHDANHGAWSYSPSVNRVVGLTLDLVGGSSYVWRQKHNVRHHTYSNVDGLDADIDAGVFLRLAPSQPRLPFHRFQHAYAWVIYGFLALKWWVVDDVVDLARGTIGGVRFPRPPARELVAAVAGKLAFFGWAVVAPVLWFGSAWPVVYFVAGSWVVGVVLSVVFQLAHIVPGAEFHDARGADRRMATGFAEHQVRTTVDFAPGHRLLTWYLGGLNYQVEHHLFPRYCHLHYPALASIVEETCRDHGIPYRSMPTLRSAIGEHHRLLRALGSGRGLLATPATA
jgi:linoleoyl-CoA desaturase